MPKLQVSYQVLVDVTGNKSDSINVLITNVCIPAVCLSESMFLRRQCLELLSNLRVEEEETLLAELQQLKEEEEALVKELEAVEEQRAAVAQDLTQCRIHSQQLDTEELQ